jgi:hypothetical protein
MKAKKKMQNVQFSSVDDFFEFLPEAEKEIVERLRAVIMDCIPDCTEKLAYNVPYYKKHANICFIWPPAVSWGGQKQSGVRLGFVNGNLLQDELNYLDKGDRKQVYWKEFHHASEIETDILKMYLFNAIEVDERNKKAKAIAKALKKMKL